MDWPYLVQRATDGIGSPSSSVAFDSVSWSTGAPMSLLAPSTLVT